MATCVDCQTKTDKPYCCGDNKPRCEKCAVTKYKAGIIGGVITRGIMRITPASLATNRA